MPADKLPSHYLLRDLTALLHQELETEEYAPCPEFRFPAAQCCVCNGYYGPCFGEPVCATCHAFLFPNDVGLVQPSPAFTQKTDDEDSGNDEPTDLFYNPERRLSQQHQGSPQNSNSSPNLVPAAHGTDRPSNNAGQCYPASRGFDVPPANNHHHHHHHHHYHYHHHIYHHHSQYDTENPNIESNNNASAHEPEQPRPASPRHSLMTGGIIARAISRFTSDFKVPLLSDNGSSTDRLSPQRNSTLVLDRINNDRANEHPDSRVVDHPRIDSPIHLVNGSEHLAEHSGPAAMVHPGSHREFEISGVQLLSERLEMLSNYKRIEHEPINEADLVDRLPPEVLLVVFSHLDDVSLWSAANVCRRWFGLLSTHVTQQQWRQHVKQRWPLYKPIVSVRNWYRVYDYLASSAPCRTCLAETSVRSRPRMEENSWRGKRLRLELKSLRIDPPEGIEAMPLDQMCCHWQATITGPVGSPYEGGLFYLYVQVPYSYPMCPPVVRFLTKILHPNVSRHGDVGIDSIHHNWSLALTIPKVLISVQSLLTDPYCQVCMEPELGEMYVTDREKFNEVARSWTWRYAMHDVVTPI